MSFHSTEYRHRKRDEAHFESIILLMPCEAERPSSVVRTCVDANRIDTAFAGRIRAARLMKGWSSHRLAKHAGVALDSAVLAETRPWDVPFGQLTCIADALGDELLSFAEDLPVVIGEENARR